MIISYITLLPIDNQHADPVVIGITIKPLPVIFNVIEPDVVAKITNVSNAFNIVVRILYFRYLLFDLLFLCLSYLIISFMLLVWLLKLLTSFNFFSGRCSKPIFSNGADGYNLFAFASLYSA